MKGALFTILLTLAYIFLLTVLFENFINKPSNTYLSLAGIILFFLASYLYATIIIKQFKNRTK